MKGGADLIAGMLERLDTEDPATWETSLSPEGARRALAEELTLLEGLHIERRYDFDRTALIWCAGNVFTAPLRWIMALSAMGWKVVVKAPSAVPRPALKLAAAAWPQGLASGRALRHQDAFALLEQADALLAFGSDAAMDELDGRFSGPRSLHGHRCSFAIVSDQADVNALALDAALYDGQGCMSPAGVFVLGDARAFAERLAEAMARMAEALPRGPVDPAIGPSWRTRIGLAHVEGHAWSGPDWAVPLLPVEHAQAGVLPRMLPVHPVEELAQLNGLSALPLSSCATDLEPDAIEALGFWRVVAPGQLQRPAWSWVHDGWSVEERLCR